MLEVPHRAEMWPLCPQSSHLPTTDLPVRLMDDGGHQRGLLAQMHSGLIEHFQSTWTPGCLPLIDSPLFRLSQFLSFQGHSAMTRHACHLEALARHGDRYTARAK